MKINRLFEIVYILLDKQRVTAAELAEHFEVSPRTIMRDIEILSESGVPVFTVHGKGGGISLMDGFILNKTLFISLNTALPVEQKEGLFKAATCPEGQRVA